MPGKFLILLSVICYLLSVFTVPVLAQAATPLPTGKPSCDLCGWCSPEINPKPSNWNTCRTCLYDASGLEQKGNYYTVFGCLSTKPELYVKSVLGIVFGVAGGLAFLAVLAGSAIVLTSAGYPERIQTGKDLIVSSLFGLLLIVFSVFLLRVVGFDLLRIPGFG